MISTNRKRVIVLIILTAVLSGISCKKEQDVKEIILPPTHLKGARQAYALVTAGYLYLREQPSLDAAVITTLWKGNIFLINSRLNKKIYINEIPGYWYRIQYKGIDGWGFSSQFTIYESEKKAKAASEELE